MSNNVNIKSNSGASNGGTVYSDTSAYTGNWFRIDALSDSVFTTLTGNVSGMGSTTLKAGQSLYGSFTAITLASGAVVAYNE
tara:strand:- start:560 stop:805 length:246 start_codon:yes stop_codon:yes gene_type:complete